MNYQHPIITIRGILLFLLCLAVGTSGFAADLGKEVYSFSLHSPLKNFNLAQPQTGDMGMERYYDYQEDVIDGFFIKYGTGFSNITEASWLISVGHDFSISRNIAIGLEIMPSYFSVEDSSVPFSQTGIPFNAFINIKGGLHLGGLVPFLKFLKVFAGGGGGVGALFTSVTFDGDKLHKITFDPAFHVLGGIELDLGFVSLIGEYQKIKIMVGNQDPDPWLDYFLFGLRF